MKIFGRHFRHLDDHHLQNLLSLEREKAIYADHWIDGLDDFRHVRIALTDSELVEYVRSMEAYDLFLGSGARWAREVKGIPTDIAARADGYQASTRDGKELGPPWHCVAGFIGPQLESVLCFDRSRTQLLEEHGIAAFLSTIRRAVDALTPAIRCFNSREKRLTLWPITCEDDVRDLLFAMLRASIADMRREKPVPSRAGSSKVADLSSSLAKTLLEVKWIGKRGRWKTILDQIRVDVQTYGAHPDCRHLVFVVIDAVRDVPDPHLIETQLTGDQVINGKPMRVLVYIREP